jgi:fatty acid desaturase
MGLQWPLVIRLIFASTEACVNRNANHECLRKSFSKRPWIMAVSVKRHNEEAAGRPVDKK